MATPQETPDPLAHARQLAKDGWIFLALSLAAVLAGVGVFFILSIQKREGATAFILCFVCAFVFFGGGVVSLIRAWRAGLKTLGLSQFLFSVLTYCLVIVAAFATFLLSRWPNGFRFAPAELISLIGPPVILSIPLARYYFRTPKPSPWRAAAALGICFICLFTVWALAASGHLRRVSFGMSAFSNYNTEFWIYPAGLHLSFGILGIAGVYTSLRATLLELRAIRIQNPALYDSQTMRFIRCVAWSCTALILFILTGCGTTCLTWNVSNSWAVTTAIVLLLPVLMDRTLLAGPSLRTVSFWRRMLTGIPLLLLALFVIIGAGMAGSCVSSNRSLRGTNPYVVPRGDWVWHLPERVRGPMAALILAVDADATDWAYSASMLSIADLRDGALKNKNRNSILIWRAWAERDPQGVLKVALAVPATSGSRLPSTSYDLCAGCMLGTLGSTADVRARLTGGYSTEFVGGMMWTLPQPQVDVLAPEIIAYFKTSHYDGRAWGAFARKLPQAAEEIALANISAPSASNYADIEKSLSWDSNPKIVDAALHSNDVVVRKTSLQNFYYYTNRVYVKRMRDAAMGRMPHADADEQRLAANILVTQCEMDVGFQTSDMYPQAKNITPLTTFESQRIYQICVKAEAWLAEHQDATTDNP